jgi:hypothetical protein
MLNLRWACRGFEVSDAAQLLTMDAAEQVSGGMMKLPGTRNVTVFYDDGINVLTSDPTTSNVITVIK